MFKDDLNCCLNSIHCFQQAAANIQLQFYMPKHIPAALAHQMQRPSFLLFDLISR
jgi:hypothetical protein